MLKKLGKYELIELVGHGAMGEVYKAHDPSIGRLVALKTITGSMCGNAELLERFYQEARSAGALQHPNIVTVYELGHERDTPFIAMEFLEGESLDKIIERRPNLPISQKVGILVQVCRALDCAHKHGVVHRDIKPGNVMLTRDGTVKVVDFGIARLVDTSKTQTNILIGTLAYMSPEQFHGERANQRSDIWGLGVLLFELLCYKRPFEGENTSSLILNIVDEKMSPPHIRDHNPDFPLDLDALIDKMLKKAAGQRFQTMEEVLFEIEPIWRNLQEESITGLIVDSEVLIQAKDYARARELLRKALQIDRRNERANLLLEMVTSEIKQIQIRAQIESAIDRGQGLLKEGRYKEARAEAEAALKLDATFVPANEFLAEVELAAVRAKQVQESLQLARQRLAEGALTEAAEEVRKVLSIDAGSVPAHTLDKQIQEHLARRAERKKRAEVMQRARKCWGEQQLNDCIEQLTNALKEFPNDSEIRKLLETAIQDKAEQERQEKLADAKSLFAMQQFDEALAILESLSADQQNHPVVQKLSALVVQEREEHLRQQRLQEQAAALQSLVNAGQLAEAVLRGEELIQEFPLEAEFVELVLFARSELAQREEARSLDEAIANILEKIQAGTFAEAVVAAESALARFPCQAELESLLKEARGRLKEEKNRELLQKRIVEIRRKINVGHLTDAVDLARQTLAITGPNVQLSQMLSAAEMELAQRQSKIEEQQKQLAEAQKLLQEGQFQAASQVLVEGIDSRVLSEKDPTVQKLLNEIQEREPSAAPIGAAPIQERTEERAANSDPAKEYVFQELAPFAKPPLVPETSTGTERASVTLTDAVALGPVAPEDSPVVLKETGAASTTQGQAGGSEIEIVLDGDGNRRAKYINALIQLPQLLKGRMVPIALTALALVTVLGAASLLRLQRSTKEIALLKQAQQLEQQKKWPEALSEYEKLAGGNDTQAKQSLIQATRLKALLSRESLLYGQAQSAEASGNVAEAKLLYQEIADLDGDMKPTALDIIEKLQNTENPSDSYIVGSKPSSTYRSRAVGAPGSKAGTHASEGRRCMLLNASDIERQLDRAEKNRARGDYVDARREYNGVLDCDSKNVRAQTGLNQTIAAEAVQKPARSN